MHKALLSALSAAAIFAAATFADRAAAMTVAPLASQTIVEKAAIICAGMGCSPVETKRIRAPQVSAARLHQAAAARHSVGTGSAAKHSTGEIVATALAALPPSHYKCLARVARAFPRDDFPCNPARR